MWLLPQLLVQLRGSCSLPSNIDHLHSTNSATQTRRFHHGGKMILSRGTAFCVTAASLAISLAARAHAASFTQPQIFATGAAVGATSPDSVTFGDGSVWVAYQNGADSAGASGASKVVRYSPAGSIISTWSIAGNVDGLKVAPSGQVWALQNNDGNSALTIINPTTNATTAYSYGR